MTFMKFRSEKSRYNTETGILLISQRTLRLPRKESQTYFEADLYRSRGGEYFLFGKGGELSVFRGQREERILPLSRDEAEKIAKEFMKPAAYQEEFGVQPQSLHHAPL